MKERPVRNWINHFKGSKTRGDLAEFPKRAVFISRVGSGLQKPVDEAYELFVDGKTIQWHDKDFAVTHAAAA